MLLPVGRFRPSGLGDRCRGLMLAREQMETLQSTVWIQAVILHETPPGKHFLSFMLLATAFL